MSQGAEETEDVVIVGSGPAGYTAALYTARADLKPLVIEGFAWGGLLQETTEIENFPGYPQGVMGPEMMQQLRDQAERFGSRLRTEDANAIRLADAPGGIHEIDVGSDLVRARTVVLAMGATHRKLGVPGEGTLSGRGVSYCATCDAAFFRDVPIVVVGGGDSAMEEAIFLSKFGSEVVLIHRRDEFRASKIMVERARRIGNLELLTPYAVEEFVAGESGALGSVRLKHTGNGEQRTLEATGAFIAVGHVPTTQLVEGQIDLDEEGYAVVDGASTRTSRPGVFAAGDISDPTYRQAITAAASGCRAALDAEWYLRDAAVD